jgi:xylan 1,4-beta-xylosidase
MKKILVLGLLVPSVWALLEFPDCIGGPLASNKVCDTKVSPADRAAALVAAMTINEKLVNLVE